MNKVDSEYRSWVVVGSIHSFASDAPSLSSTYYYKSTAGVLLSGSYTGCSPVVFIFTYDGLQDHEFKQDNYKKHFVQEQGTARIAERYKTDRLK